MPGMSMAPHGRSGVHGGPRAMGALMPHWLAIAWVVGLLVVFTAHCAPLVTGSGRQRVWHALHLAMAVAMAAMYASASILSLAVTGPAWTVAFVAAALIATAMLAADLGRRRSTDLLWPPVIMDLIAMAYMLRADRPVAVVSWVLVALLAGQAALWTTRSGLRTHSGSRHASALMTVRSQTLRPALALMAASMAYMLIAMQVHVARG